MKARAIAEQPIEDVAGHWKGSVPFKRHFSFVGAGEHPFLQMLEYYSFFTYQLFNTSGAFDIWH